MGLLCIARAAYIREPFDSIFNSSRFDLEFDLIGNSAKKLKSNIITLNCVLFADGLILYSVQVGSISTPRNEKKRTKRNATKRNETN